MNKKFAQANLSSLKAIVKKFFGYYPVMAPLTMLCILFSSIVPPFPPSLSRTFWPWWRNGM